MMLELRDVSRMFGRREGATGVAGLEMRIGAGEIVALVGLNGAGKTTLMRLALGMLRPDTGVVLLDGIPLDRAPRSTWCRVGHLVETPLAYPELTARDNLRAAAELHGAAPAVAEGALRTWGLEAWAGQRVRRLSLGNRQRVGLAAALQHDPGVVVLDEPGNALDPAGVMVLRAQIDARARAGAAVLVSSHHLDEVARIAHRIVLMNRGRLIGELDPRTSEIERAFFRRVADDDAAAGAAAIVAERAAS